MNEKQAKKGRFLYKNRILPEEKKFRGYLGRYITQRKCQVYSGQSKKIRKVFLGQVSQKPVQGASIYVYIYGLHLAPGIKN
jgi:hypothetical protein